MSDRSEKMNKGEAQNVTGTRAELRELLGQFRTALLVTTDDHGYPRARPLAIAMVEADGRVWFATNENTPKVTEIATDAKVAVLCHRSRDEAWISLSGTARLVRDMATARRVWHPELKAWFSGPDDPSLMLIEVRPKHAEYYEASKPMIARAFEMVKGMVTHEQPFIGATKHVTIERYSDPGSRPH
jgi:general stress protein 26